MRVRLTQSLTGFRDGIAWPGAGQEIELPDWEAENLIGVGYAKAVADEHVETPEDGGEIVAASGGAGDDAGSEAAPPADSGPAPDGKRTRRKA